MVALTRKRGIVARRKSTERLIVVVPVPREATRQVKKVNRVRCVGDIEDRSLLEMHEAVHCSLLRV